MSLIDELKELVDSLYARIDNLEALMELTPSPSLDNMTKQYQQHFKKCKDGFLIFDIPTDIQCGLLNIKCNCEDKEAEYILDREYFNKNRIAIYRCLEQATNGRICLYKDGKPTTTKANDDPYDSIYTNVAKSPISKTPKKNDEWEVYLCSMLSEVIANADGLPSELEMAAQEMVKAYQEEKEK